MEKKAHILIVEDEEAIRTGLIDVFVYHGFDVDFAADGTTGLDKALTGEYDLILLDVMLPGVNGFEICETVRSKDRDQPIIMLTAKSADEDIVQGLTLGADDYVAKPFSIAQLVLRVQAVLRRTRTNGVAPKVIRLRGGATVDVLNLCGTRQDESLSFTRREMDVLEYLSANADRPVSREELLANVWGYAVDAGIETRTVDIHIAKIRRKVEIQPGKPDALITVRGAGYRLLLED
ncbi:MAG: response regulator transcription factor [Gammaproteobacteria bacterium]|nr:response regulator transcription factor [Gammaproteobacteria bacterium]